MKLFNLLRGIINYLNKIRTMKKSILISLLSIAVFGCSYSIPDDNNIIGYWEVVSSNTNLKGVVKIDSLNFYFYIEEMGHLEDKNYYTRKDSLFFYHISSNDTIIDASYLVEYRDENNMKLINTSGTSGGAFYKRISEEKMKEYIKACEKRTEEIEIIKSW